MTLETIDTKVIVALIAVFVSFIGLIITKEQKTSEFRQKWIDDIRNDISDLMGGLNQFYTSWLVEDTATIDKRKIFLQNNLVLVNELYVLIHRIVLRLNSEKDKVLINKLSEIEAMFTSVKKMEEDELFEKLTNELTDMGHALLKKEWERVKKGEPIFRFFKYIFGTVTLLIIGNIGYEVICKG